MIYFTSDTHFNHTNIIKYCDRPFEDINEMNKVLIKNWNKRVGKREIIYHLGDFGFGKIEDILNRLNGQIILIQGSHEKSAFIHKDRFKEIVPLKEILYQKQAIVLCHYAMRVWPKSHYNSWHLFGHSHGTLEPIGKSWDVGVDNNNFTPLSFNEIKEIMDKRENNPNFLKRQYPVAEK
jgi:calcineurin-like phosphoesterase family protein